MANLIVNSVTSNSIDVYISGLDTNYSRSDRYVDFWVNGVSNTTIYLSAYISQTPIITLSGLSPNTYYDITAIIWYTAVEGGSYSYVSITNSAITSAARPSFFYWTYAKTQGNTFNLTAAEWNGFMDNINLVRAYKGLFTVSYTTAITGNAFTAAMYNQAYSAVNGMYNYMTTMGQAYINATSVMSSGDIITANSLNYLQLSLNTVT